MKFIFTLLATSLIAMGCSSPSEKYDDQRMEAKKDYNKSLKQAEEEYQGEESGLRKERAKDMVDESEDVNVDIDNNEIDLEE